MRTTMAHPDAVGRSCWIGGRIRIFPPFSVRSYYTVSDHHEICSVTRYPTLLLRNIWKMNTIWLIRIGPYMLGEGARGRSQTVEF